MLVIIRWPVRIVTPPIFLADAPFTFRTVRTGVHRHRIIKFAVVDVSSAVARLTAIRAFMRHDYFTPPFSPTAASNAPQLSPFTRAQKPRAFSASTKAESAEWRMVRVFG